MTLLYSTKALVLIALLFVPILQSRSAPFRNLGFEEADTNRVTETPSGASFGPFGDLLPGWTLREFPNYLYSPDDPLGFNNRTAGRGNITLVDSAHTSVADFAPVIEGNYHFALSPKLDEVTQQFLSDSLFQIGDVPEEARSIQFYSPVNPFELRANDTILPLVEISSFPKFFAADISAFAGQTVELKFTTLPAPFMSGPLTYNVIDAISFSPSQIPEPNVWTLIGLGGLIFSCMQKTFRIVSPRAN